MATHRMRRLSQRGDDTLATWDPEAAVQGDTEAQEAVKAAERLFRENTARGEAAFAVDPETKEGRRLDAFDRTATEILVIPRMAGG